MGGEKKLPLGAGGGGGCCWSGGRDSKAREERSKRTEMKTDLAETGTDGANETALFQPCLGKET